LTFYEDKDIHISDHIQEWHRRKLLIKDNIPPEFLLEWFVKSLFPYISMDVSTTWVTTKEETIYKSQKLDLVYAQSGILYEIIPEALWSNNDPRQNLGAHADGTIQSACGVLAKWVTNLC
jgi:hypothetical protein